MKLNYDCLHDLLLLLEEELTSGEHITLDELKQKLTKYSGQDIAYTIKKAKEAGLVEATWLSADNDDNEDGVYYCHCTELTYDGHCFLNCIRNVSTWEKIKSATKKVGGKSIEVLIEIAANIASNAFLS